MTDASLGLSVVAALLSVIALGIAIRHLRELQTTHTETHTLRQETLAALGLHRVLVQDADLLDTVRDMGNAYAVIKDADDPFFHTLAKRELMTARQRVQSMSGGRLTYSEEDITGPLTFASFVLGFAQPGDEFCTSSLQPPSFWRTETSYLEQNREQRERGVTIKRAFIFNQESEFWNPEAQWAMRRQHESGIMVSYSIEPKFEIRDIIVLKKPRPDGTLDAVYAGEILLRKNGAIASIDIWSIDSNQEKVMDLKRTLEVILASCDSFAEVVDGTSAQGPANLPAGATAS